MKNVQKDIGKNWSKVMSMPTNDIIKAVYTDHTKTIAIALQKISQVKKN